jgi:hypothetical protein
MDEGGERVIGFIAAILASLHMQQRFREALSRIAIRMGISLGGT